MGIFQLISMSHTTIDQSVIDAVQYPTLTNSITSNQLKVAVKNISAESSAAKDIIQTLRNNDADHETRITTAEDTITTLTGIEASDFATVNASLDGVNSALSTIVLDSLTSTDATKALSAKQGKNLKDAADTLTGRLTTLEGQVVTVSNSLTNTSTTAALSAAKGKILKDAADALASTVSTNSSDIATLQGQVVTVDDSLTNTSTSHALSAAKGKALKDAADALASTVSTLQTSVSTLEGQNLNSRITTLEDESGITVVDVINSTSATDALSANQGKILNDGIISLQDGTINGFSTLSNGSNLDFGASATKYKYEGTTAINIKLVNASTDKIIRVENVLNAPITLKQTDGSTDQQVWIMYNGSLVDFETSLLNDSFVVSYDSGEEKFIIS